MSYFKHLKKVHTIFYLTSGQCIIFDINGEQIPELQSLFPPGKPNLQALYDVASSATSYKIMKFRSWVEELSKEDFFILTNLINFQPFISVKDKLPKNNEDVLCFVSKRGDISTDYYQVILKYIPDKDIWSQDGLSDFESNQDHIKVTHWKPLQGNPIKLVK